MSKKGPLVVVAAAMALSACSTVQNVGGALWPFDGNDGGMERKAPLEGREPFLTDAQKLQVDAELGGRAPVTPAALPMPDWSQAGGLASNAPSNVEASGAFNIAWSRNVGAGSSDRERISAPPVVADGKLFLLDAQQTVHAVDAGSGRTLWSFRVKARDKDDRVANGGGVAVAEGKVFVASGFGALVAIDASTGAQVWRSENAAPFVGPPTVVDGRAYVMANEGSLLVYNTADGSVLWTEQAIAEPARILAAPSAAVVGDTVIAPFASGEVIAFVAQNGRRLWAEGLTRGGRLSSLSAINDIPGRPVVYDGVVYAASHSGFLAGIRLTTGERLWDRAFASTQTPWVAGDAIYAVNTDGELAAFERVTPELKDRAFWVTPLRRFKDEKDRKGRISWAGPLMAGGKLFLANSLGEAVVVDPSTGKVEKTFNVGGPVFVPPIAANGTVYLLTDEARLVALR
jgi:outer membrane protein assembly factor BamB